VINSQIIKNGENEMPTFEDEDWDEETEDTEEEEW
jgi:hypothetical protein